MREEVVSLIHTSRFMPHAPTPLPVPGPSTPINPHPWHTWKIASPPPPSPAH